MPELPEVESIKNYIHCNFNNKQVQQLQFLRLQHKKSSIVRFPVMPFLEGQKSSTKNKNSTYKMAKQFSSYAKGKRLKAARIGKLLFIQLYNSQSKNSTEEKTLLILIVHLRMSGLFLHDKKWQLPTKMKGHGNFILSFKNENLYFLDTRTFGTVDCFFNKNDATLFIKNKKLGVEATNFLALQNMFLAPISSGMPVKNFLLNQEKVLGLGNIYASESLFLAGINPRQKVNTLTLKHRQALPWCIAALMHFAIAMGGVTIEKDSGYRMPDGVRGFYMARAKVYKREEKPCWGKKKALNELGNFFFKKKSTEFYQPQLAKKIHSILNRKGYSKESNKKILSGFNVYLQILKLEKNAKNCNGVIKKTLQAGRSSYYCNTCQK